MLNINTPNHGHSVSDLAQDKSFCETADATNHKFTNCQKNVGMKVLKAAVTTQTKSNVKPLSSIELDLLKALHTGASNRKIALERGKSAYTVRNQLSTLYSKIGVTNRIQALVWLQASTGSFTPTDAAICGGMDKPKKNKTVNFQNLDLLNLHNIFGKPTFEPSLSCEHGGCHSSSHVIETYAFDEMQKNMISGLENHRL